MKLWAIICKDKERYNEIAIMKTYFEAAKKVMDVFAIFFLKEEAEIFLKKFPNNKVYIGEIEIIIK